MRSSWAPVRKPRRQADAPAMSRALPESGCRSAARQEVRTGLVEPASIEGRESLPVGLIPFVHGGRDQGAQLLYLQRLRRGCTRRGSLRPLRGTVRSARVERGEASVDPRHAGEWGAFTDARESLLRLREAPQGVEAPACAPVEVPGASGSGASEACPAACRASSASAGRLKRKRASPTRYSEAPEGGAWSACCSASAYRPAAKDSRASSNGSPAASATRSSRPVHTHRDVAHSRHRVRGQRTAPSGTGESPVRTDPVRAHGVARSSDRTPVQMEADFDNPEGTRPLGGDPDEPVRQSDRFGRTSGRRAPASAGPRELVGQSDRLWRIRGGNPPALTTPPSAPGRLMGGCAGGCWLGGGGAPSVLGDGERMRPSSPGGRDPLGRPSCPRSSRGAPRSGPGGGRAVSLRGGGGGRSAFRRPRMVSTCSPGAMTSTVWELRTCACWAPVGGRRRGGPGRPRGLRRRRGRCLLGVREPASQPQEGGERRCREPGLHPPVTSSTTSCSMRWSPARARAVTR